jgi:hypothetical protein
MLEQKSGVNNPHRTGRDVRITLCPQTPVFEIQVPMFVQTNSGFQIFVFWDSKNPHCIHIQFKMKRHFTNACFMPVRPFATTLVVSKVCDSPLPIASVRGLL